MRYILLYILTSTSHVTTNTAPMMTLFACEKAAAQVERAAKMAGLDKVQTRCLDTQAMPMTWKGKQIQPGTGDIKR